MSVGASGQAEGYTASRQSDKGETKREERTWIRPGNKTYSRRLTKGQKRRDIQ